MDTWTEHHRTLLTSQLQILMFGNTEQQWHVYKREGYKVCSSSSLQIFRYSRLYYNATLC